jgi:hypothetical protein
MFHPDSMQHFGELQVKRIKELYKKTPNVNDDNGPLELNIVTDGALKLED